MNTIVFLLASNAFLLLVLLILTTLKIQPSPTHSEKRVKTDLKRIKDQVNGKRGTNQL